MKNKIIYLAMCFVLLAGCKEDNKSKHSDKENEIIDKTPIELVKLKYGKDFGNNSSAVTTLSKLADDGDELVVKILADYYENGNSGFEVNLIKSRYYFEKIDDLVSLKRIDLKIKDENDLKIRKKIEDIIKILETSFGSEMKITRDNQKLKYIKGGFLKCGNFPELIDLREAVFLTNMVFLSEINYNNAKIFLYSKHDKYSQKYLFTGHLKYIPAGNAEKGLEFLKTLNIKLDELRALAGIPLYYNQVERQLTKISKYHFFMDTIIANVEQFNNWRYPYRENGRRKEKSIIPNIEIKGQYIEATFLPTYLANGKGDKEMISKSYNIRDLYFERNQYHKDFCYLKSFSKGEKIGLKDGRNVDQSFQVGRLNSLINACCEILGETKNNSKRKTFSEKALEPTIQKQFALVLKELVANNSSNNYNIPNTNADLHYRCKYCNHTIRIGDKPFVVTRECPSDFISKFRESKKRSGALGSTKCAYRLIDKNLEK